MKAKKSFGQHFLKNKHLTVNMAGVVEKNDPTGKILEVGPGKGVLTVELMKIAEKFKAVELDRDMVEYLLDHEILKEDQLISEDFLKLDLEEVFDGDSFTLAGNYPYNISSRIVIKMIHNYELIPFSLGMFQYEMAKRITGKQNTKDYGSLSILTQLYYDCKIIYRVKPGDFSPPPKVQSAEVQFQRKDTALISPVDQLESVLRKSFSHRRKKIKNNLLAAEEQQILNEMKLADLRAEQIPMDVFVEMTKRIFALRTGRDGR